MPRARSALLFTALAVTLAAASGGCRAADPDDPVVVVEGFLDDLSRGRAEAAWGRLTAEDQAELAARARRLASARGEPADTLGPAEMLDAFGLGVVGRPETLTLASRPGERVEVRVNVEDGASASFTLVRQSGAWRVALLASLTSTAAAR